MEFVYEQADIELDNITVEKQFYNGNHIAHRLTANDGYVMCDTEEEIFERDKNRNKVQVTHYCRQVTIPVSVPVENWTYVAVLESMVGENYIFGNDKSESEEKEVLEREWEEVDK